MTGWPVARLDECCLIVSGATPSTSVREYWGGDIPWATPKDLSELTTATISDTPRKLTTAGLAASSATLLPPGSVLFSSRAPIGHVAINTVAMATNQGFKSFVPNPERIHAPYLYWWLQANRMYLQGLGNGATFKEVSKAVVSRIEIPLPPLPEQRRIADILDQADALRAKRRVALADLDNLTKSVFLEIFGDPVTNPKHWPLVPIGKIGTVVTGNTPSRAVPGYFGNDIEWIKSDNINTPEYFATRAMEGLSASGRAVARVAPSSSILVTCIAGSPDCIGNSAMTDRPVAFNQQINAVIPKQGDVDFIYAQLIVGKRLIQQASTSSMKGMVSKSRLQNVQIIFPPVDLQRDFATRVSAIQKLKEDLSKSLAYVDSLFASLQYRAFRDEL